MIDPLELPAEGHAVVAAFGKALGGILPSYNVKHRPDGMFLRFEFAAPSEKHYGALNNVNDALEDEHPFKDRVILGSRKPKPNDILALPETAMLQRELAASLTVDKNTFGTEFLDRYTPSVTELEKQIIVHANHVVFGRRGSGKSSLLAYAMHHFRENQLPFAWIAMQTYASRADKQAIASVLGEIFSEAASKLPHSGEFSGLAERLLALGESDDESAVQGQIDRLLPRMRKILASSLSGDRVFTIFLDDFHVVAQSLQPELLATIYSLARGNRTSIKISGIEQLTNLWDGVKKRGLEPPHDVQTLKLDHNLTTPDQSKEHIKSILDRHARFCGFPTISYLASDEFMDRLVLSAAAVPRDALSLFSKSIGRSISKRQKTVSITSLNAAASEAVEEKLKDIEKDIADSEKRSLSISLDEVKRFCLTKKKTNAFLIKIANSDARYENIQKLVALRFIHVLDEGTTPHSAGQRFVALMLDYGFYIGIRTAKSVRMFPEKPRQMAAKEIRTLPIMNLNAV